MAFFALLTSPPVFLGVLAVWRENTKNIIPLLTSGFAPFPVRSPPVMVWSRCTWPVSRNPGRVTEVDYADLQLSLQVALFGWQTRAVPGLFQKLV